MGPSYASMDMIQTILEIIYPLTAVKEPLQALENDMSQTARGIRHIREHSSKPEIKFYLL